MLRGGIPEAGEVRLRTRSLAPLIGSRLPLFAPAHCSLPGGGGLRLIVSLLLPTAAARRGERQERRARAAASRPATGRTIEGGGGGVGPERSKRGGAAFGS